MNQEREWALPIGSIPIPSPQPDTVPTDPTGRLPVCIQRDDQMTVQATDPKNALVPSADDIQAKLAKAAKLDADVLDAIDVAHNPAEKLQRQVKLGKAFVARARFQRDNTTDWSKSAYSDLARRREEEAKLVLGINDVQLDVSTKIFGFVDAVKAMNPLVEQVSYFRIAQHFIPMFDWNCVKLEGQINPDWLDFVCRVIDDNAKTKDQKPISIKALEALIEEEKQRHAKARFAAGPDDKELEKKKKTEATRARNAAIKRRDDARDGFNDAAEALAEHGDMTKEDLTKHFIAVAEGAGIELPTVMVREPFNPASLDVKSAVEMMNALYAAAKLAEIHAIVNAGQKMLQVMLDAAKQAA